MRWLQNIMDYILSLAVSSHRLPTLSEVLKSLLLQSVEPRQIILWISPDPFLIDKGVRPDDIPQSVRSLVEQHADRVLIRTTENTGPHRKLLPLLAEVYQESDPPLIVMADDDTLYPPRWLEALLSAYQRARCAIAFRARIIQTVSGGLAPYSTWPLVWGYDEVLSYRLMATGKDGLLVHPKMFHPDVLKPAFRELCPSRSDAWIAASLIAARTPMLKLSKARVFPNATGTQPEMRGNIDLPETHDISINTESSSELWLFNASDNDLYIRQTFDYFGVSEVLGVSPSVSG